MEELLFGVGIALLISLLAWSDQIRSLYRETVEAESILLNNRSINYKIIKKLLRKKEDPQVILNTLTEMLKKNSSENIIDLELLLKFRNLDRKLQNLENLSNLKYYFVIGLTGCFLISGIIFPQINACSTFSILSWAIHFANLPFIICITFCGLLLAFLVYLNFVEKNYRNEFDSVMDEL